MSTLRASVAAGSASPTEKLFSGYFTSADPRNFMVASVPATVLRHDGFLPTRVDVNTLGNVRVLVNYGRLAFFNAKDDALSCGHWAKHTCSAEPTRHQR